MAHEWSEFQRHSVKSFFSQHDRFEHRQIAVQQNAEEDEIDHAPATQDYWQVDPLRRELIRFHTEKRRGYHNMSKAKRPIPKEELLGERETHVEYKSGKKELL